MSFFSRIRKFDQDVIDSEDLPLALLKNLEAGYRFIVEQVRPWEWCPTAGW